MNNIIYRVSADDGMGGERNLGTASGEKNDIIKYFEPYKPYKGSTIYLSEISLINVTSEMANKAQILLAEKERLENKLKEINNALK
ncbi:MAG: hypothetical protein L0F84_05510 [Lactococcus raffinolactis]|nr:hypothetical protein [Lactococcus raffinolactis]